MNVQTAGRAAETSAPVLLRERDGEIAVLVLNRPAARNSLSEALIERALGGAHRYRSRPVDPRRGRGGERACLLRRP